MTRGLIFNLATAFWMIAVIGCWDEIEHEVDETVGYTGPAVDAGDDTDTAPETGGDAGGDAGGDGGSDAEDTDTEQDGQGIQPPGWEGFGKPCKVHDDCKNIPLGRCIENILGLVNAPGGYCVACCNQAGIDVCAPGIDCIGEPGMYLVCINTCESDDQCRQEEGYRCLPVWYLAEKYPGRRYCMPSEDLIEPPEGSTPSDPQCNWPWLTEGK